jgi:hypothetical protein
MKVNFSETRPIVSHYQPWWMRLIRSISWFSYRYWWFVWMLFVLAIMFFFYRCSKNNDRTICYSKNDFNQRFKTIDSLLYDCCDCTTSEKAIDCPDRELVFQVCNSNKAIDDNFDVFLNDQFIGQLDLSVNDNVGAVFIASLDPDLIITDPDFSCPISKMKVYRFDPEIVRFGENILVMKNTKNNRNNNEGSIEIRNYLRQGINLVEPCKVTDLGYMMASGADFRVIFNYTRCCE